MSTFDPGIRPTAYWKARLAALSRNGNTQDPRLLEAQHALQWHRDKRQAEAAVARGIITQSLADKWLAKSAQQADADLRGTAAS
ncbi:MAG: hypothetical protein K0U78_14400 [Actinomycetia bacterium]|nr:hypothetical protein [Actinomycetes bacterium]